MREHSDSRCESLSHFSVFSSKTSSPLLSLLSPFNSHNCIWVSLSLTVVMNGHGSFCLHVSFERNEKERMRENDRTRRRRRRMETTGAIYYHINEKVRQTQAQRQGQQSEIYLNVYTHSNPGTEKERTSLEARESTPRVKGSDLKPKLDPWWYWFLESVKERKWKHALLFPAAESMCYTWSSFLLWLEKYIPGDEKLIFSLVDKNPVFLSNLSPSFWFCCS